MWKANRKTTTLFLFLDSLFPKTETHGRYFLQRQNNPEVNYSPHLDFWGGGFKGKYQAADATARISHITSTKLEQHTKVAVQKCHQSVPTEDVLVTLLQDILSVG
jgi:hypothetical protein